MKFFGLLLFLFPLLANAYNNQPKLMSIMINPGHTVSVNLSDIKISEMSYTHSIASGECGYDIHSEARAVIGSESYIPSSIYVSVDRDHPAAMDCDASKVFSGKYYFWHLTFKHNVFTETSFVLRELLGKTYSWNYLSNSHPLTILERW